MKILKQANRKKLLIVIGSVLVAVALIAGGAYGLVQSVETGATNSITKSHTDAKNALQTLNAVLAKKELTAKERLNAFDQLNQTLVKLSNEQCKDQKNNIVYDLTKVKDRCDSSHQKLNAVKMVTQNIEDSIKDDQALAAIMNPAKATDPTDPAKQLEIWTTVVSKLQAVKVSSTSTELKKGLVDTSTQYRDGWKDLIAADKEHNKANYEGTIKRLQAVQGAIVKVSEQQTAALSKLSADLKTAATVFQKS
jgi:hypothetical protein